MAIILLATRFRIAIIQIMKKKLFTLFLMFACGVTNATEFKTKAKSALLIDYDSGTEIVAKNADTLMPPSSMIKLMTLKNLINIVIKNG